MILAWEIRLVIAVVGRAINFILWYRSYGILFYVIQIKCFAFEKCFSFLNVVPKIYMHAEFENVLSLWPNHCGLSCNTKTSTFLHSFSHCTSEKLIEMLLMTADYILCQNFIIIVEVVLR